MIACGYLFVFVGLHPLLKRRWPDHSGHGGLLAAVLFVHLALWVRFDQMVNVSLLAPKFLGALGLVIVVSLALARFSDGFLAKHASNVRRLAWAVAFIGFVMTVMRGSSDADVSGPTATGPNVVLVTLDTTRWDSLSIHGDRNTTPNIAKLAQNGVVFDQAVATAPLTEPSHLAILTGNPPSVSGLVSNGTHIGDRPELLSVVLQQAGYQTAGFVSGFPLHGRFGWKQGMDVFDDDFGRVAGLHRLSLVKAWDQVMLPTHALRERPGDGAMGRALEWLSNREESPFFLWVHLFDPHAPYEAPGRDFAPPTDGEALDLPFHWPEAYREITSTEWLTEAYMAEVRTTDQLVGQLLDALEDEGLEKQTVFVLTADHGESLTEHDYLFDHGDHLYDPSLRVPMVFHWPGHLDEGVRVSCQSSNMDITPTLLALLDIVDDHKRVGIDRSGELTGGGCVDTPVVSSTVAGRFVQDPPVDHSLRADGYKLIAHAATEDKPAGTECYNLLSDPEEVNSLEPCLAGLESMLTTAVESGTKPISPEMDEETRLALEALGYVE